MDYFDGINFVGSGKNPRYASHLDTCFNGYYGIQYTHSGGVYCSVNNNTRQYSREACAFITYPGARFRYGPEEGAYRHHSYVCFNGPRVNEFISRGLLRTREKNPLIVIKNFELFFSTMRDLHDCLASTPKRQDRAVYLLEGLLLQLATEQQDNIKSDNSSKNAFTQLVKELNESPERDWDFHKEAAAMNISYMHFRRLFSRHFGCPPGHFLQITRLNHASEMLCSTDAPISEIAESLGFYDIHHFSKLFKKHFMIPPASYRKEFKKYT